MSDRLLEVRDLSVHFDGLVAVDGMALDLGAGEVVGLIGPNGAGKTTLIDALTGFVTPSSGVVRLDGVAVTGRPPHLLARAGLTRTFQTVELFDDLSVAENLAVAATGARWWSPLRDALWPTRADAVHRHEVEVALERAGVAGLGDVTPRTLSNGQRHRVALARALVGSPRVLLLDEPAAGLDDAETAELATLVRELAAQGTSVLLVDHDMVLVMGVCDRMVVMDRGSLLATGTPEQVRSDPAVVSAYLGGAARG